MAKKKPKVAAESQELDNQRRELFCRYYAQGEGTFGNATLSYAAAYEINVGDVSMSDKDGNPVVEKAYKGNYATCSSNGYRLLRSAEVQARLVVLRNELLRDEIVDAELAKVITQDGDLTPKVAAIKEFNKLRGRIIDQTKVTQVRSSTMDDIRTLIVRPAERAPRRILCHPHRTSSQRQSFEAALSKAKQSSSVTEGHPA